MKTTKVSCDSVAEFFAKNGPLLSWVRRYRLAMEETFAMAASGDEVYIAALAAGEYDHEIEIGVSLDVEDADFLEATMQDFPLGVSMSFNFTRVDATGRSNIVFRLRMGFGVLVEKSGRRLP